MFVRKWTALMAAALVASVALPGWSAAKAAPKLTSVTMEIDGAAVPYYAPLYVAQQKGYFAQHGLKVNFIYGNAADITKNVAVGNVQFGFPNADDVIAAYANGIPVRIVDTTMQHGIGALIFLQKSGIKNAKDLVGKTVGITSYGSPNYIQLQVMLKKAHVPLSAVHVKIVGTGSIISALTSGQVDAIDFSMIRTYALRAQGVKVGQILSDSFLPDHGNVVITSANELKTHPQIVKDFILALHQGISWIAAGHETAAVNLSLKYAPSFKNQVKTTAHILRQVYVNYLWKSKYTKQHGYGYGDLASYQTTIDVLAQYKVIPHKFPAKDLVVEPASIR